MESLLMSDNIWHKIIVAISDPQVSIPLSGAIGGIIRAVFKKPHTIFGAIFSIVLGALFASWFTMPIVTYLGLGVNSYGGVGAILGISSYELARIIATGEFLTLLHGHVKSLDRRKK
jgi:hypothetical protein